MEWGVWARLFLFFFSPCLESTDAKNVSVGARRIFLSRPGKEWRENSIPVGFFQPTGIVQ
jgi:hypothetical protein